MTCITKKILSEVKRSYVVAEYFSKLMQQEEDYIIELEDAKTGLYDIELSAIARIKEAANKKLENLEK